MGVSNSYFDFKQFRIAQEGCAMKVTTDACIQGAWTELPVSANRVLDIGTGTGLLALMLVQKDKNILIDAAELDKDAADQARINIAASPWPARVNLIEGDIKNLAVDYTYDLIISNPPFFNNSLLSDKEAKNKARHTVSLSYQDLFTVIEHYLTENGIASVLLPYPESEIWEQLVLNNGWYIISTLSVRHTEDAQVKRKVTVIGKNKPAASQSETLVIKNADGSYTREFIKLMAPYYLHL